jgi:hypothetical protein
MRRPSASRPAVFARRRPRDKLGLSTLFVFVEAPAVVGGIRGTKFELLVRPDQTGHVKLFEGEMDWRSKHSDTAISLSAKQMITFGSRGEISNPIPFQ